MLMITMKTKKNAFIKNIKMGKSSHFPNSSHEYINLEWGNEGTRAHFLNSDPYNPILEQSNI